VLQIASVPISLLIWIWLAVTSCSQAVPSDLLTAIDDIDQRLISIGAPRTAPDEYTAFASRWAALKIRVQTEDDLIRWPWESNHVEDELRHLLTEGAATLAKVEQRHAVLRDAAESTLARLGSRLSTLSTHISSLGNHILLGKELTQTDLLLKQAQSFFAQGDYARSLSVAEQAAKTLDLQAEALTQDLQRYADSRQVARWRLMVNQTIEWSRTHRSPVLIVSKVDRQLSLYQNGRKISSYPVRLGYNGLKDKLVQGDGATPEGRYHVSVMKGEGETQFYRALLLDYPNAEDRRRFLAAIRSGAIPQTASIGGQIEIHGMDSTGASQTLGCIMLDNQHMKTVFSRVTVGTPVTIVGALTEHNPITVALTGLQQQRDAS
jgi:lipoprotein-anchoring transpeptidase ErfK/SrfK